MTYRSVVTHIDFFARMIYFQKRGGKGREIALVSTFFACGNVFHNFHVLEAVSERFEIVHTPASFQMEPDKGDH